MGALTVVAVEPALLDDAARVRRVDERRHGRAKPPVSIDRAICEAAEHIGRWAVRAIAERLRRRRGLHVENAKVAAAVRRLRPGG